MKKCSSIVLKFPVIFFVLAFSFLTSFQIVLAEDKPAGSTIPKLPKTANDPVLSNGKVYPFWGPICQRYTYSVVYSDKDGRPPEYVKIYFNGEMLDMEKENPSANDYKKGVKYIYKNIPNKFGSNFYFFEASNGLGKARDSIIDSPDNGPVLFDTDFKDNEIVLIDLTTGKESWRFPTGEEWVGAVAFSAEGKYLAAQTSNHVYFFDTQKNKPLWEYRSTVSAAIGGDVKGGVAISADGGKIFAALSGRALMFSKESNRPVWTYNLEQNGGGAYGVDLAKNGQYAAVAMAGSESDENTNVLILFDSGGKKLWQYHSSGNWHEVNFSADGQYLAGATGCPDRRGYLFSKDSSEPIIRSEPLSEESPIDESRISADGSLVAYGVESGYGTIVLMDKSTKQIVWKYETPQGRSVRALSMTPNGEYIGAGTFGGDILIFDKNSSQPKQQLKINSAIGAFDLADDGSVFATGSADKKIRIFQKDATQAKAEIELEEYVGELDMSANGKYVAAGTSGAVYFFESLIDLDESQTSACDEVIEPPEEDVGLSGGQNSGDSTDKGISITTVVFASLAGLSLVFLVVYFFFCRRRNLPCKKSVVIIAVIIVAVFLGATVYFSKKEATKTKTENSPTTGDTTINDTDSGGTCGNSICEPDLNENKDNCAKDCLSGN